MRHSKLILAGLLLVTTSIHSCSKSNFAGSNGSLLPTKKSTSATGGDPPMVEAEGGACVPGPETLAFNETPTGVLADKMDLTSSLQTGQDGRAPLQLFVGKSLADNQKVYLDSSSGLAIFRVYQGRTEGSMACGVLSNDGLHGFYLEFKDASGAAIIVANQNFSISKYPTGVSVPIGAVSAWLGYRDSHSDYFDNEGFRTPNSGSTNGCTFALRVTQHTVCE